MDAEYPKPTVDPELFGASTACTTTLPVGEVLEWFDFGQFVELYATDSSGMTHPLVVTQDDVVLQASLKVREDGGTPTRTVDLAGGVPLNRAAAGEGDEAFKAIGKPVEIPVADVDELVRTGRVVDENTTYRLNIRGEQATALRDGERILLRAHAQAGVATSRAWVLLVPKVHDVKITDLNTVLAERSVSLGAEKVGLRLEPTEVKALLAGMTVVVRGTSDEKTVLLKLRQFDSVEVGYAAEPAVTECTIGDLPAFLTDPTVPGMGGLPYKITLTSDAVKALRAQAPVQIAVAEGRKITLRMGSPPSPSGAADSDGSLPTKTGSKELKETTPFREGTLLGEVYQVYQQKKGAAARVGEGGVVTATQVATATITPADKAGSWSKGEIPLPAKPPAPSPPIPSLHVALFLPWRQLWTLKGLSRGRLLHSLSLAPQEEATLELFTWERHKKTLEQTSQTDTEQSFEGTDSAKDTSDVYSEVNRQRDFQWQVSGSLKATYRPAAGEVSVAADAHAQNRASIGEIGKTTQSRVHEAVVKASTKVRAQRVTKINETVEWGREEKVARKVRNPNMCHTLNLDYYEVLAHYTIETSFLAGDARLCAFVPNPLSATALSEEIVRRNETALGDALLDGALREGFDSVRYLAAYDEAIKEQKRRKAEAAAAAQLGKPLAPPAPAPAADQGQTKEEKEVIDALKDLHKAATRLTGDLSPHPALEAIAAHDEIGAEVRLRARRWLFQKLMASRFGSFSGELDSLRAKPVLELTLEYARQLVAVLPPASGSPTLATLGELSDTDKEEAALAAAIKSGHMKAAWDWGWWTGRCREESLYRPDDLGIPGRVVKLQEKWQALEAAPAADKAAQQGDKAKGDADARQDQQSAEDVLEMKFPLEQVAQARERAGALMAHLADHWNYYRFALFQALPPSEQLERMLASSSGVLRAGMFEPRVVSVHGDQLAVPLNTANYPGLDSFLAAMTEDVKDTDPNDSTILLPTPGLSIESRLGQCSGCEEYIERSRSIELRLRSAQADQAEYEAARYQARVEAKQLEDPSPTSGAVKVELAGKQS